MKRIGVGIVGLGNMGEAILRGIYRHDRFTVAGHDVQAARQRLMARRYRMARLSLAELVERSAVVVLCVKPQEMDGVLTEIAARVQSRHTVISIAAGIGTGYIEKFFSGNVPVVRVMPNMGALIGEGISAFCRGRYATAQAGRLTRILFGTVGALFEVPEKQMDAVTAVSGSGPGFIAFFLAAFVKAARRAGLPADLAALFCRQTLCGTAGVLARLRIAPEELVRRVASKGGTTEAGLAVLQAAGLERMMVKTVQAAAARARRLSKR
ncbi:MAG: pyrroline-5-carboxylate reductase [Candidatus Omnitrophica bacterium]|nr:pyrroline-5-carboxylate reductase [Candidatus Omnitrophota bacterium]